MSLLFDYSIGAAQSGLMQWAGRQEGIAPPGITGSLMTANRVYQVGTSVSRYGRTTQGCRGARYAKSQCPLVFHISRYRPSPEEDYQG